MGRRRVGGRGDWAPLTEGARGVPDPTLRPGPSLSLVKKTEGERGDNHPWCLDTFPYKPASPPPPPSDSSSSTHLMDSAEADREADETLAPRTAFGLGIKRGGSLPSACFCKWQQTTQNMEPVTGTATCGLRCI